MLKLADPGYWVGSVLQKTFGHEWPLRCAAHPKPPFHSRPAAVVSRRMAERLLLAPNGGMPNAALGSEPAFRSGFKR